MGLADDQLFEVAASDRVDFDGEIFGGFGERVVDRTNIKRDAAGVGWHFDAGYASEVAAVSCGAAVRQVHGDFGLRRMGQADGIAGGFAFGHRRVAADARHSSVRRVSDGHDRWRRVSYQALEVAASGASDRGAEGGIGVVEDRKSVV